MNQHILSEKDWRSMIAQQQTSTLTIDKYCESMGVTTGRFYYYKKKLQYKTMANNQSFLQASMIEERTTKVTHTQTCGYIKLDYHGVTLTLNHVSPEYVLNLLKGLAS